MKIKLKNCRFVNWRVVGALFNSSGEKLFLAVGGFDLLRYYCRYVPTNAYVFAVVDPFHPERRPKIWMRLQATACHHVCYVLVQSIDDLK